MYMQRGCKDRVCRDYIYICYFLLKFYTYSIVLQFMRVIMAFFYLILHIFVDCNDGLVQHDCEFFEHCG